MERQIGLTLKYNHKDPKHVELFWNLFNHCFKEEKESKTFLQFKPIGWCTDMTEINFNRLKQVYCQHILDKIKGCKFHCQESINRKMKQIGDKGPRFKLLVNNLLTASTPEAYSAAKSSLE